MRSKCWAERIVSRNRDTMLAAIVRAAAATPPPVARPDVTASRAELSEAVRQWAAAREAAALPMRRMPGTEPCRGADGRLADFVGLDARITNCGRRDPRRPR